MSTALCFKCGSRKKDATTLCKKCMAAPRNLDDLVLSFCLSLECVSLDNLQKCRQYFKQKNRPPRFREEVIAEARPLAERFTMDCDASIQFSADIMDFPDLEDEVDQVARRRTVTANIVGRPRGQSDNDPPEGVGKKKTCHIETWVIGRHISHEQMNENLDGDQIFVWYRWIQDRWSWTCISKGKYAQLKAMEDGNPF